MFLGPQMCVTLGTDTPSKRQPVPELALWPFSVHLPPRTPAAHFLFPCPEAEMLSTHDLAGAQPAEPRVSEGLS